MLQAVFPCHFSNMKIKTNIVGWFSLFVIHPASQRVIPTSTGRSWYTSTIVCSIHQKNIILIYISFICFILCYNWRLVIMFLFVRKLGGLLLEHAKKYGFLSIQYGTVTKPQDLISQTTSSELQSVFDFSYLLLVLISGGKGRDPAAVLEDQRLVTLRIHFPGICISFTINVK